MSLDLSKPKPGLLEHTVNKCPRCHGKHEKMCFWPILGDQSHFQWMANCRTDPRREFSPVLMDWRDSGEVRIF